MRRRLIIVVLAMQLSAALCAAEDSQATWFEKRVRPVLVGKCLKCHGEKKQEGNLRLDSLESMLRGGDSGPAIVPGRPGESLLIEAVRYDSFEMPPSDQLPPRLIRDLELWVTRGAPWPRHEGVLRAQSSEITALDQQWWAFQPLEKPPVPQSEGDDWSSNEIDRFVYRKLAEQGMRPAPPADKAELVRRLYFDLIGLPPTPQQIDDFLADDSQDAWSRLIDTLLADERYGEHWARYWLDIVRYSESDGWNQDAYRPHIWRYRDYVVQAFNDDKPYPEFVREQLAGDEIPSDSPTALAATGFLRLGIYEYNQRDAKSHWDDILNEMTDVAGDVFLGMGMACARCHDHKFDPLLQKDYFQLRAFFEPVIWRDDLQFATAQEKALHAKSLEAWEQQTQELQTEIQQLLSPYYDRKWQSTVDKFPLDIQACFHKPLAARTSWEHQMAYLVSRQFMEEGGGPLKNMKEADKEQYESLQKQLAEFDHCKPAALPPLMAATDFAGPVSPTVIPDDPAQTPIAPGFLSVLTGLVTAEPTEPAGASSGRRTALAEWIGQPDNPLTTRVIVNRIWQEHFGKGIVSTANDFGHLGRPPTHPELLDWLTSTFVAGGWSIKDLHKRILMSATWRQSARHPEAADYQERDPNEDLLWRARVRRLKAEQIRDAMLMISGELLPQIGGPSVDGSEPRRSLYVKSFRNTPDEFLHAFDIANGLKSVSERNITTTPSQSLLMINGDATLQRAEKLAQRMLAGELTLLASLNAAFRATWGRDATESELQDAAKFVAADGDAASGALDPDKLIDFCHVLLNSNEFLYVD